MPNSIGQPWSRRVLRAVREGRIQPFTVADLPAEQAGLGLDVPSAWVGLERLLPEIIDRFDLKRDACLEFGVEFGYSTAALSAHFEHVTGVDIFTGDIQTGFHGDHFAETRQLLSQFSNITLFQEDYRSWIERDASLYDLIHVDILHTYEDTYRCGLWSAIHSTCTLFHDTERFDVRAAVADIAAKTRRSFYDWPMSHGLGIIV